MAGVAALQAALIDRKTRSPPPVDLMRQAGDFLDFVCNRAYSIKRLEASEARREARRGRK